MPRPERELPSFGRPLLLAVIGALTFLVFAVDTIVSLLAKPPISLGFWSWIAAAETAAWHLKWAMIPVTLLFCFGTRKIYRSIRQSPANFCGLRYARSGYYASVMVPLFVLILIGITVPERLHHRQDGIESGIKAQAYRIDRALVDYREKYDTLPSDLKDLARLPDTDGTLAVALKGLDRLAYTADSEVAAAPTKKPQPLRGAVILNASVSTSADEPLSGGITFTNYRLRLPGNDKVLGNEDDFFLSDGLVQKIAEVSPRLAGKTTTGQNR